MALAFLACLPAWALDPNKTLTQYSRTSWTEEQGLPQDTIRAITQTRDGYLWLGTDEGLARFDGYEFNLFNRARSALPSDSIAALSASPDGTLWIGSAAGLTRYQDRKFQTFTVRDGLPDNSITEIAADASGGVWVIAGIHLSHFQGGKFTNYSPGKDVSVPAIRRLHLTKDGLWLGGLGAVLKLENGKFTTVLDETALRGGFVTFLTTDRQGNLWVGASNGLVRRSPNGKLRTFDTRDGLPDPLLRAITEDRDGNIWVGTNAGLARLEHERFVTPRSDDREHGLVRCLFEDREGNLWVGANSGLTRFRDTRFLAYGKSEGLPADEPNTVYQDRGGRIWIGFHDSGLMQMTGDSPRVYTMRDGLPNDEIFSIHEARNGDLLIGSRGLVRMHGGRFTTYVPPDPLARLNVFDAIEDSRGAIWLATPGGLGELRGDSFRMVVPSGGPILAEAFVTIAEGPNGEIWAGTQGKGLWRVAGGEKRGFTETDGLSSDQIRSLHFDAEGNLWIGTFGGGLSLYRDGKFQRFSAKDGLLSDNVAKITSDGESLWLSTTRGICRVPLAQLREMAAGQRKSLEPENFGVEDGLRSAQCAPSYPVGGGGTRTADGRLWFTTSRGIAVYSVNTPKLTQLAPEVHMVELSVDGTPMDLDRSQRLGPKSERIQIRYAAVHLSAPEQVRYAYRLSSVDSQWVSAGTRRTINYNSLGPGKYNFAVRAEIPGGPPAERSFTFEVLPRFYEMLWFRMLVVVMVIAAAWAVYQLRLRQIRYGFSLVLEERARLAREIHDTLAQGFVGISSQLDAVAMCMPADQSPARQFLDLARRMARHSLTEARRSVMDLRSSVLEGQDLAAALESGARMWTAGSGVGVDVDASSPPAPLPEETEQHLLRIAQEAVTNVVKHAGATHIAIKLHIEARKLFLLIKDNGRGFEPAGVFSTSGGHFGILGMRERAERLGGELKIASHPQEGTEVEVRAPIA